jgi:hypothetical protein
LQVLGAGEGALAAFEDGFGGVWHRRRPSLSRGGCRR